MCTSPTGRWSGSRSPRAAATAWCSTATTCSAGDESAGSRLPGHHKGDRYGYPVLHLDGDSAYAIHSIEKEDVAVCRFRLRDLT